jgi:cytoskeletal protein RodZ
MSEDGRTDDRSLGEILREARTSRSLSIEQLSSSTRISPRMIEALESDDPAPLGTPVYARNFIRTLARELGLDADGLVGKLEEQLAAAGGTAGAGGPRGSTWRIEQVRVVRPSAGRGLPSWRWLALVAAVALAVLVGVWLGRRGKQPSAGSETGQREPSRAAPARAGSPAGASLGEVATPSDGLPRPSGSVGARSSTSGERSGSTGTGGDSLGAQPGGVGKDTEHRGSPPGTAGGPAGLARGPAGATGSVAPTSPPTATGGADSVASGRAQDMAQDAAASADSSAPASALPGAPPVPGSAAPIIPPGPRGGQRPGPPSGSSPQEVVVQPRGGGLGSIVRPGVTPGAVKLLFLELRATAPIDAVVAVDDAAAQSRTLEAGQSWKLAAHESFTLHLPDPGAVEVWLDGARQTPPQDATAWRLPPPAPVPAAPPR